MAVRIDKWLWAVRGFKTRNQASIACAAGKVRIDDSPAKASKSVEVGQTVSFKKREGLKIYQVEKLITKRVSAKLAADCFIDKSPEPDKIVKQPGAFYPQFERPRGAGRPTKKERRIIDRLKDKD